MKKILGFGLQCAILITLGYSFLNSRLLLVADWLSPVLSSKVYSFLTLLFLVLGDPVQYPELLMIWGISAILMGIIMRKPVDKEKEAFVHFVGMVLLLGLMVVLVFKDLMG